MGSAAKGESRFLALPPELRNDIYRRVLVPDRWLELYMFTRKGFPGTATLWASWKPPQWLTLLFVNRQVHSEANSVFYRCNQFLLSITSSDLAQFLGSFLDCIGPTNAGLLSSISINFPTANIVGRQPTGVVLREDAVRSLKLMQGRCTGLTMLKTFLYPQNAYGLVVSSFDADNPQSSWDALAQIDAHYKAIPSLRQVRIKISYATLAPQVVERMQAFGWVV